MKVCLACARCFEAADWTCPTCGYTPPVRSGHLAFAPELAETNDGFEAHYFDDLAGREAGNFWFRARNRLLIWALRQYFPDARNFLEIGCGTGFVLSGIRQAFPSLTLAGSEIFDSGLQYAAQRLPGVWLFQMDARCLPFEREFDALGAFDVLEHIAEDEAVLAQMFRAVKPGGGVMLTVPQHQFLWSYLDDYSFHKRRYERTQLIALCRHVGFHVERITSFVSLLVPLMLAARIAKQRPGKNFDPLAELSINPLLNTALERGMGLECRLIQAGVSFPIGGSLLVIARRPASPEGPAPVSKK